MMRRTITGLAAAAATLLGASLSPAAQATPQVGPADRAHVESSVNTHAAAEQSQTKSCTAWGFTAWINFHQTSSGSRRTADIDYRISKGSNSGGNRANLWAIDYNGIYHQKFANADNGIQDNKWHHFTRYYREPNGEINVDITLDKSGSRDPICSVRFRM